MTAGPAVSFVIPVREDPLRLAQCLDSIRANADARPLEIIVADNGSRDATPDVARSAGATVLSLPALSVAQLRNAGARAARSPILAFVDADHVVAPGWLASALETLAATSAAAVGAPYLPPAEASWVQRAYNRFRQHVPGVHEVEWLGSGNLVVRREAFQAVGGFDESLETCEDVDLCNRLRMAGHRLLSDDRLRSAHLGDPATVRALFASELWRGRDNITVTLRGPLTLRAMPSLVIPIVNLAMLASVVVGFAASPWLGAWPPALASAVIFLTVGVRVARMRIEDRENPIVALAQNLAVALVYEAGRALALVVRATHRTRRQGAVL